MKLDVDTLPLSGWYPGHMLKAGRRMREVLKLVDLVVELVDARIPASSRNPRFRSMLRGKSVCVVGSKADLADSAANRAWEAWFAAQGECVRFMDARTVARPADLAGWWKQTALDARRRRGAERELKRPVRIMICGIPNVGKSTLVNALFAGRRAAVGPKPGVTRDTQWVPLQGGVELLDTPGVLWPSIERKTQELRLGLVGTIPDTVLDVELLAEFLWAELRRHSGVRWEVYGLDAAPEHPEDFIEQVAARRGCWRSGGVIDRERAANAVLKDFRDGRLGTVTLERAPADAGRS